jgi:hypothetical protein
MPSTAAIKAPISEADRAVLDAGLLGKPPASVYERALAAVPNAKRTKVAPKAKVKTKGDELKVEVAKADRKAKAEAAKAPKEKKVDHALRSIDHVAKASDVKDLRKRDATTEAQTKGIALQVKCPTCGSAKGAPCMERGKVPGLRNAHGRRLKEAQAK